MVVENCHAADVLDIQTTTLHYYFGILVYA